MRRATWAYENMEERSIILKKLGEHEILQEYDVHRSSRVFIGLINSFSFNCRSRPNRITGLPVELSAWASAIFQLVSNLT